MRAPGSSNRALAPGELQISQPCQTSHAGPSLTMGAKLVLVAAPGHTGAARAARSYKIWLQQELFAIGTRLLAL